MKKMINQDGEWEVYSGYKLLIKTSRNFENRREIARQQAEIAQAERDAVQAKRDACIEHLKKIADLSPAKLEALKSNLTKAKFKELELEMSFEDIIESVRVNREASKIEQPVLPSDTRPSTGRRTIR